MSQRSGFQHQPTDLSRASLDKNGYHGAPSILETGLSTSWEQKEMKGTDEHHGKDAAVAQGAVPAYDSEEEFGQIKVVSDAKDIVTSVLHVEDDPSLSPWTFRMVFLGMPTPKIHGSRIDANTQPDRSRIDCIRSRVARDLLLQAADDLCVGHLFDGHRICPGRRYGSDHPPSGHHWPISESVPVQLQGACSHCHYVIS